MIFFDTHAHICSPHFTPEEQIDVIKRAQEASVTYTTLIATEKAALLDCLFLKKNSPHAKPFLHQETTPYEVAAGHDDSEQHLFIAAATPPHDITGSDDPLYDLLQNPSILQHIVAIGETGLDYFYHEETKQQQQHAFIRYISFAIAKNLPIIIHCRDAFADLFAICSDYRGKIRGIIHCFTGTAAQMYSLCELGFFISISGIATFPKTSQLQHVIPEIPLEHLLIETDAPYLAPEPFRGKKNEPSFLPHIAKKIATLRNTSIEEVADATTHNGLRLFAQKN